MIAGLAAGFLVGRARRLAGSGGLLTLLRALAPLLASVQAGMQAAPADGAGTDAAP